MIDKLRIYLKKKKNTCGGRACFHSHHSSFRLFFILPHTIHPNITNWSSAEELGWSLILIRLPDNNVKTLPSHWKNIASFDLSLLQVRRLNWFRRAHFNKDLIINSMKNKNINKHNQCPKCQLIRWLIRITLIKYESKLHQRGMS